MFKATRSQLAKAFVAKSTEHGMSTLVSALARILVDQKMTDQTDLIIRDIARELQLQTGQTLVYATTAREISESLKKEITKTAQAKLGATDVVLSTGVDSELLGGVVIQTADEILDMSVRSKLKALRS